MFTTTLPNDTVEESTAKVVQDFQIRYNGTTYQSILANADGSTAFYPVSPSFLQQSTSPDLIIYNKFIHS